MHRQDAGAAIAVSGLRKSFDGRTVLDGLDLLVRRGEIFALLGPNGAGKTTTINVLTTLVRPDAGTAAVAGFDVADRPDEVKRRIALTGQAAAVDDVLTARENLVLFARLVGLSRAAALERAAELLGRFDLAGAADRRVASYSGGMRRRLDLALSFVAVPEVLFLDEPTTGLDTRSRRALWEVIRSLADAGTTVLLTTQYLEEADALADRIAVLDGGRIVASGTVPELKAAVGGIRVEVLDEAERPVRTMPSDGTVPDVLRAMEALHGSGATGPVRLRRPTLDDVFLSLTSAGAQPAASRPTIPAGTEHA